jgi:dTDP-4-dehydrorhamnose reductase
MSSSSDRIIVVGGDSMIGSALSAHLKAAGCRVMRTTRRQPDFVNYPQADEVDRIVNLAYDVADWQPPTAEIAYLCAAVTSQEACGKNQAETRAVNVVGTLLVAEKLAEQGTNIVFLSTNLVLSGEHPQQAADEPYGPRTEYGRQKAEVEQRLLQLPKTCVVRFTKVLCRGTPLLTGWRDSLIGGQVIHPFAEMPVAPVTVDFAVAALGAVGNAKATGIFHVSASHDITYADVARTIALKLGVPRGLVQPVTAAETSIPRECIPAHTTLDTQRLENEFGLSAPSPWDAIELGMQI